MAETVAPPAHGPEAGGAQRAGTQAVLDEDMAADVVRAIPYAVAFTVLYERGWRGVLPLPAAKKDPPPTGYTGADGQWPSYPDMFTWATEKKYVDGNTALRLPADVLGVDVDHYGDKHGGDTLADLESRWGVLPATWTVTSRVDGISGVRLFRVPEGLAWDDSHDGIDMLATYHRYLVAPGSVHDKPPHRVYRCDGPDGEPVPLELFPRPEDLPLLPAAWVVGLAKGEHTGDAKADLDDPDGWLRTLSGATEPMCSHMERTVAEIVRALPGGRHNGVREPLLRLVRLPDESGCAGVVAGLVKVRDAFLAAVTADGTRSEETAQKEFRKLLKGACGRVAASPTWWGLPVPVCRQGQPPPAPGSVAPGAQPATGVTAPVRTVRVTWASDIDAAPVVWVWVQGDHDRIPAGALFLCAGREGTGKSSFGIWLAAQISRGTLPGLLHSTPRRVLYVAVEDSWKYTIVPRLLAAGADLRMVGRVDVVVSADDDGVITLSLPQDIKALEASIVEHDVALVMLDPLMSVVGEKIDTHRNREVRTALEPLVGVADRTGAMVGGVAHFNKGSGTDAASLITGSGAFKEVPRVIFGFVKDGGDDRVMTQVKNSLGIDDLPSLTYRIEQVVVATKTGPAKTGKFLFTGESDRSVEEILGDQNSNSRDRGESPALVWLRAFIAERGGEVLAREAIPAGEAVGFTEDQIKIARRRARHPRILSAKAREFFGGWTWTVEGDTEEAVSPIPPTPSTPSTPSMETQLELPVEHTYEGVEEEEE